MAKRRYCGHECHASAHRDRARLGPRRALSSLPAARRTSCRRRSAGRPVLEHTLAAVRASGLPWHLEDAGHPGMGDSIAAAVRATADAAGWLILPADLPLVQPATLQAVARALVGPAQAAQPQLPRRARPSGRLCRELRCRARWRCQGNLGAAPVLRALREAMQVVGDRRRRRRHRDRHRHARRPGARRSAAAVSTRLAPVPGEGCIASVLHDA